MKVSQFDSKTAFISEKAKTLTLCQPDPVIGTCVLIICLGSNDIGSNDDGSNDIDLGTY